MIPALKSLYRHGPSEEQVDAAKVYLDAAAGVYCIVFLAWFLWMVTP